MNKPKKPYNKLEIIFENFLAGEFTGTSEMIKKTKHPEQRIWKKLDILGAFRKIGSFEHFMQLVPVFRLHDFTTWGMREFV